MSIGKGGKNESLGSGFDSANVGRLGGSGEERDSPFHSKTDELFSSASQRDLPGRIEAKVVDKFLELIGGGLRLLDRTGQAPLGVYPGGGYKQVVETLSSLLRRDEVRLVGLIFGGPFVKAIREEIIPRIDYLHHRSAKNIEFFCVGFYKDGQDFSAAAFNETLAEFERRLDWKYKGETDLILLNARFDRATGKPMLDFSTAVSLTLERALEDKAIQSVPAFIEDIIAFAGRHDGHDPSWGFSDVQGRRLLGSALKHGLLSLIPESLRGDAKSGFYFHVKDLRPKS